MCTLLIRADASEEIGAGHVMRCLALAQAWQDSGGRAMFAMNACREAMRSRLRSEGIEVAILDCDPGGGKDARATAKLAQENAAKWIAVDGYFFGTEYQKRIKDEGFSLLFVDDNAHTDHYRADLVLNQNLHACEEMYAKREPYTRLLLGSRYALLRREFLHWRDGKSESPEKATRLLVTLGGADPDNVTSKVISAIEELDLPELETKVVVGPLNKNLPALQAQLYRNRQKITLLTERVDMPELLAWADAAVAGAGSTSWELCFMGVPSLLIVLAENQIHVADKLEKEGAAVNLGECTRRSSHAVAEQVRQVLLTKTLRIDLAEHARGIVDGRGAQRVVRHLRGSSLKLRPAQSSDCKLLWGWANDPEVRAGSFSNAPILWEEHVAWFTQKMAEPNTILLLGIDGEGEPVGQVRLDLLARDEAVVHVSVASPRRGSGFGRTLIGQVVDEFCFGNGIRVFHAYIRPENQRSIKAFEHSGFALIGHARVRGTDSLHFVRRMASRAIAP